MLEELEELRQEYVVNRDETKILFLKIIEQSIRDYINLARSSVPIENQYYDTAAGFLFDLDYYVHWGTYEVTLEDILAYLDIDFEWFQRRLQNLME